MDGNIGAPQVLGELAYDGARQDQPLLEPTLDSIPIERPEPTAKEPQGLCLDRATTHHSCTNSTTRGLMRVSGRRRRRGLGRGGR